MAETVGFHRPEFLDGESRRAAAQAVEELLAAGRSHRHTVQADYVDAAACERNEPSAYEIIRVSDGELVLTVLVDPDGALRVAGGSS